MHPERIALEQPPSEKTDRQAKMKEAVLRKLRQSYPALAAKMPNPPSLEQLIAQAEKRFPTVQVRGQSASSAAEKFVFAEDRLTELARLLGIPDGPVVDSYRYLAPKAKDRRDRSLLWTPKANSRSDWNDRIARRISPDTGSVPDPVAADHDRPMPAKSFVADRACQGEYYGGAEHGRGWPMPLPGSQPRISYKIKTPRGVEARRRRPMMPQSFYVSIVGAAAGVEMVRALLHRQWLTAGICACILVVAVATTKSESANTFHHHARRALRSAGMLAGICTLLAVASFAIPNNIPQHPIFAVVIAAVVGAVFGGGAYVAIMALGAAWDAAIARMWGHR
jgi:hypothetical protein